MTLTIKNSKPLKVHVTFTDDTGAAAEVDGDVRWSTSDASIARVSAMRPDTATAVITPAGPVGSADITATADARIGHGVRRVSTTLSVNVTAGEATGGHITPIPDGSNIPPPGPVDPNYGIEAPPPEIGGGPAEPPPVVGGGPVEPPPVVGGGPADPDRPADPGYGVEEKPPHVSTGPVPPERPADPGYGKPEDLPPHASTGPVEPPPHASGGPVPPKPQEPPAKPNKRKW